MKLTSLFIASSLAVAALCTTSCSSSTSYAELLTDETHAVNYFLANHRVINTIPADTVFEYGEDAPYYRIDADGNIYMQVINPGNRAENCVEDNELIYFRYTRYNLQTFMETDVMTGTGNSLDMWSSPTSFRFGNTSLSSSTQYGTGVQVPLQYLGIDCEVNIVIKSQYGFTSEISNVIPYMYNLRYFKSPL
jgi:hypothetical protein